MSVKNASIRMIYYSKKGEGDMEEKRILVVDDEVSILLAFKKLLQRPFVQVDTCESMEEAIYNIDHFLMMLQLLICGFPVRWGRRDSRSYLT